MEDNGTTLMTLVQTIEKICLAHVAISDFDYGDLQVFNAKGNRNYPMAYLETVQHLEENSNSSTHNYTVTLNIIDKKSGEEESNKFLQLQDRLMQLFLEIKSVMQLDDFFEKERVGPADILIFDDFANDDTVRLRAEFDIELDSITNDTPDLEQLFPTLF